MSRSISTIEPNEPDRAGPRRNAVETPFKRDADREFDGQRENSQYTASTSSAREEDPHDAAW